MSEAYLQRGTVGALGGENAFRIRKAETILKARREK